MEKEKALILSPPSQSGAGDWRREGAGFQFGGLLFWKGRSPGGKRQEEGWKGEEVRRGSRPLGPPPPD